MIRQTTGIINLAGITPAVQGCLLSSQNCGGKGKADQTDHEFKVILSDSREDNVRWGPAWAT